MNKFYDKSNIIGDLIKNARENKGYSKCKLCRKLDLFGINLTAYDITRIETYKRIAKDFELVALCIVLEINFDDLKDILEKAE